MSPFGSSTSAGIPGEQRLLEQDDPETGLARPGHAQDRAVRRQIGRFELELAVDLLATGRVDETTQP